MKFGSFVFIYFAQSQMFEIFFFNMYIGVAILGFLHGIFFLPVLLSYTGKMSGIDS